MIKNKLSVIIIAGNEEDKIKDCLYSVKWASEIILVNTGSTDKTVSIARSNKAKIVDSVSQKPEFSKWRTDGLLAAKGDWVFYLDTDERVTPELKEEILSVIDTKTFSGFEIPRRNFYLGREMHYGGAWPDYVKRLFKREKIIRWENELHENPVLSSTGRSASGGKGKMGYLKSPMIHITHRDLSSMVEKTRIWSKIEANLLFEANHPPVTWWRILRIMLAEFWCRGIKLQGWRDGTVGWIEVIFQVFSRFITYARLWEMQQTKEKC